MTHFLRYLGKKVSKQVIRKVGKKPYRLFEILLVLISKKPPAKGFTRRKRIGLIIVSKAQIPRRNSNYFGKHDSPKGSPIQTHSQHYSMAGLHEIKRPLVKTNEIQLEQNVGSWNVTPIQLVDQFQLDLQLYISVFCPNGLECYWTPMVFIGMLLWTPEVFTPGQQLDFLLALCNLAIFIEVSGYTVAIRLFPIILVIFTVRPVLPALASVVTGLISFKSAVWM